MSQCDPNDLLFDQILSLPENQSEALITRLLYGISLSTDTPQDILNSASCFTCLSPEQLEALKTELMCQISAT